LEWMGSVSCGGASSVLINTTLWVWTTLGPQHYLNYPIQIDFVYLLSVIGSVRLAHKCYVFPLYSTEAVLTCAVRVEGR